MYTEIFAITFIQSVDGMCWTLSNVPFFLNTKFFSWLCFCR